MDSKLPISETGFLILFAVLLIFSGSIGGYLLGRFQGSRQQLTNSRQITTSVPDSVVSSPQSNRLTPLNTVTPLELPTSTPTIAYQTLKGMNCGVTFTVPEKTYSTPDGSIGKWNVHELTERFYFVPRAEEVNGKESVIGIYPEDPYAQADIQIYIGCQDNPNKWNMEDFKRNIMNAAEMKDRSITTVHMWNRDVYQLTYTTTFDTNNQTYTVWLFSTPNRLYSVKKYYSINPQNSSELESVFEKGLSFPQ